MDQVNTHPLLEWCYLYNVLRILVDCHFSLFHILFYVKITEDTSPSRETEDVAREHGE